MPAWISEMSVGSAIALGVLVLGVVSLIAKAWKPARRFFHLIDDMAGEPARPGFPARPGLMERVAAVEDALTPVADEVKTIHHEVMPNGGESMRDEVTRNTEGIKAAHDRLDTITKRIDDHIDNTSQETP